MLEIKNLVGMTKDEASKYINDNGFKQRIMLDYVGGWEEFLWNL